MWWQWTLGPVLEQVMLGKTRFLALYLLSGLGSSVLGFLLAPGQASVGASGAIFGLVTAFFVISHRLRRDTAGANQLMLCFLMWLPASAQFTSWQGHLGGLLAGGAITLAYAYTPPKQRTALHACATAGMLLLLIALVAVKAAQLTGPPV